MENEGLGPATPGTAARCEVRRIPLTRGAFAIVDEDDYQRLAAVKWHRHSHGYAARALRGVGTVYMHRVVLPGCQEVDHINGNKADNRKCNLRPANRSGNTANRALPGSNRSGFRGVWWRAELRPWGATISVRGKNKALGSFADPVEAACAYNSAARVHYGEFARLNRMD